MRLIAIKALSVVVLAAVLLGGPVSTNAQAPVRHELIRGDMPPGLAADFYRMNNPALANHVQPVQIIAPKGANIELGADGGFIQTNGSETTVGMMVGPVYRMKITNIPRHLGQEIYPSLEIINRLYPPEGLEQDFPIQVLISDDDLEQAIEGRLVTKVIYLEDPHTALPHQHRAGQQPYFDVGGGVDALRESEKLGRPMAILRLGSRVPMPSDQAEQFDFHAPSPILMLGPQMIGERPDWNRFEDDDLMGSEVPPQPLQLPPIVPGDSSNQPDR